LCTPNAEITALDTSHPCVTKIVDSVLDPVVSLEDLDNFKLLHMDQLTESSGCEAPGPEICSCLVPEQEAQVPVTPEKQAVPMTSEQNTPRSNLHPGSPNGRIDTLTPSDSGSVIRNGYTPEGTASKTLEAFMASFYRNSPSFEIASEVGQSPSNPRKRNAKAASLPDSVTDDERPYGGEKLDKKTLAHLKRKESPVSATSIPSNTSTSNHSRERSLIPRPVSVMSQARPDPTKNPLPTDSVPVLDVDYRRFENSESPVEKDTPVKNFQVEHESLAKAVSGDTTTPLASPSTRSSLDVGDADAGKPLQNGPDMEKLSTVAYAGSPCDMTLMSESVDASFGGIPTQGTFHVQPPTPPLTSNKPRLVLVDQKLQVQCPSDIESAWYKVSVDFVVRIQSRRPRGWYELVVPGLPYLNVDDHGYVYVRIPDTQGLEFRTTQFRRHEMVKGCLIAQFPPNASTLVIGLRPCDLRFYGFLRDFKINQSLHSKVTADKHDSSSCIAEYTAICSLDLIQRKIWAEQCGLRLYIHGGPAGEYNCHLDAPKAKFQIIELGADYEAEVGITQLLVICAPVNLDMFVIKWEMRFPREEASSWMPRITALPEGYHAEEDLQFRYLDAEDDAQEIVRCEASSRIYTSKRSNEVTPKKSFDLTPKVSTGKKSSMSLVMNIFLCFIALFLWLQPVAYSIGLYHEVLRDGYRQEVRNVFCEKSKLCVPTSSLKVLGMSHLGLACPVLGIPEIAELLFPVETADPVPGVPDMAKPFVSMEIAEPVQSPVPEEIDRLPPEPVRPWAPITFRDHVDYLLGWRGPLPNT
jgi:hypothetical protein